MTTTLMFKAATARALAPMRLMSALNFEEREEVEKGNGDHLGFDHLAEYEI